jgi:hypothetical protein
MPDQVQTVARPSPTPQAVDIISWVCGLAWGLLVFAWELMYWPLRYARGCTFYLLRCVGWLNEWLRWSVWWLSITMRWLKGWTLTQWDYVLKPILTTVTSALLATESVIRDASVGSLWDLRDTLTLQLSPVLSSTTATVQCVQGLRNALTATRTPVMSYAWAAASAALRLEGRSYTNAERIRAHIEQHTDWINYLAHPKGVVRRPPLYYSLVCWSRTVWAGLLNPLTLGPRGEIEAEHEAADRPVRTRAQALELFVSGALPSAAYGAALAAFTGRPAS